MSIFRKLFEWDKKRKFGHRPGDILLTGFGSIIINLILFCAPISAECYFFIMILPTIIYIGLVFRMIKSELDL